MSLTRHSTLGFLAGLAITFVSAAPGPAQPEKKVKAGDWVQYEEVVEYQKFKTVTSVKVTVKAVDEKGATKVSTEIKTKGDTGLLGSYSNPSNSFQKLLGADPKAAPAGWPAPTEVKEAEEVVKVGAKEYKCVRVDTTGTSEKEKLEPWRRAVWVSDAPPVVGWLKQEVSAPVLGMIEAKVTRRVTGFGRK
jgi:hypothetical protein